jgi:hypothetical protein
MQALYRFLAVRVASQQPELATLVGTATIARYIRSLDLPALAAELAPNAHMVHHGGTETRRSERPEIGEVGSYPR